MDGRPATGQLRTAFDGGCRRCIGNNTRERNTTLAWLGVRCTMPSPDLPETVDYNLLGQLGSDAILHNPDAVPFRSQISLLRMKAQQLERRERRIRYREEQLSNGIFHSRSGFTPQQFAVPHQSRNPALCEAVIDMPIVKNFFAWLIPEFGETIRRKESAAAAIAPYYASVSHPIPSDTSLTPNEASPHNEPLPQNESLPQNRALREDAPLPHDQLWPYAQSPAFSQAWAPNQSWTFNQFPGPHQFVSPSPPVAPTPPGSLCGDSQLIHSPNMPRCDSRETWEAWQQENDHAWCTREDPGVSACEQRFTQNVSSWGGAPAAVQENKRLKRRANNLGWAHLHDRQPAGVYRNHSDQNCRNTSPPLPPPPKDHLADNSSRSSAVTPPPGLTHHVTNSRRH